MKKFFQKKAVMITEAVLMVVGAAGLTISGVSAEGVQKLGTLAIAGVTAIDAIVTAIAALFTKSE